MNNEFCSSSYFVSLGTTRKPRRIFLISIHHLGNIFIKFTVFFKSLLRKERDNDESNSKLLCHTLINDFSDYATFLREI